MMYIHYCKYCRRIHMLNGHKKYCPGCKGHLAELKISYLKYVNMPPDDRKELRLRLPTPPSWKPLQPPRKNPATMQNGSSFHSQPM